MARSFDEMYSDSSKKLFYGKHLDDKDVDWPNVASFEIVVLSKQVVSSILEQLKKTNSYDELHDIEIDDVIYSFIPVSSAIITMDDYRKCSKLDVILDKDSMMMSPHKILEHFFDYSLPKGKVTIGNDKDDNVYEKWIGYTKDVEIQELKQQIKRMNKMINAYKNNYFEQDDKEQSKGRR